MHVDLDGAQPQAAPASCDSTVCIVGAGIAGLILATRLAAAGLHVHLLEAGSLQQEERSQAFYAAEQTADTHKGVTDGRFRTFGGSSTRWGAQILPFTPDIFDPLPGTPSLPWPIRASELTPYYPGIQRILGTDTLPFDASLLPALGHPPVPFSPDITLRYSKWAPFAKRNLARTVGKQALAHPQITVFTHANVAALEGDGARITAARVLNYAGAEFRFTARHFVVAAGTVESSRLLLCSRAAVPDSAVPDPYDQLGRGFHDHLSFHAARFQSPEREQILHRLGPFYLGETLHTCKLEASPALRARFGLFAVMAHLVIEEPEDSGAAALRTLLRSHQASATRQPLRATLGPALRGFGDIARMAYAAKIRHRRAVSKRAEVFLNIDVEQSPNPDNRIRLSENRDALGIPVAIVDWRVHPAEQQTALRFAPIIRRELEALNVAPATWDNSILHSTPPVMADTYHAMGGLAMGSDPTSSVVDPNLRVHTLKNLSVASCAVFPSGSSSNPTFTLMALTLRLADHLTQTLQASSDTNPGAPPSRSQGREAAPPKTGAPCPGGTWMPLTPAPPAFPATSPTPPQKTGTPREPAHCSRYGGPAPSPAPPRSPLF